MMTAIAGTTHSPTFWLSHSAAPVSRTVTEPSDCTIVAICAAFDVGTAEQFSGFRVIVIGEEKHGLEDMRIREWSGDSSYQAERTPYRSFLKEHQTNQEMSSALVASQPPLASPLCTIIFEVVPSTYFAILEARLECPKHLQPGSSFRVLYDTSRLCSSLHLTLSIHSPSLRIGRSLLPSSRLARQVHVMHHHVRILPVENRLLGRQWQLPLSIILRIGWFTASSCYFASDWRKTLMSLALVQKAYLPVLKYFFEFMGRRQIHDAFALPTAVSVARSLGSDCNRHLPLTGLLPANYLEYYTDDLDALTRFFEALATIIERSPHLRVVQLPPIHADFYTRIIDALRGRREIESLGLMKGQRLGQDKQHPFRLLDLSDVQDCIRNWPNFQKLVLVDRWSTDSKTAKVSSKLQDLHLIGGWITGKALLDLSAQSCLRNVTLKDIRTLSNADFHMFLMQISSSLVNLSLDNVSMSRTSGSSEEYALDTAMPSLKKLGLLIVKGDLLSTSSIARMTEEIQQTESFSSSGISHIQRCISIANASAINTVDLLRALQVTSWKFIRIRNSPTVDFEAALALANQRGIDLRFYGV